VFDASLSAQTWFRVGGNADVLFKPSDAEDLSFFLQTKPKGIPIYIVGAGSNLLIRDGGMRGVVIRLGRGFSNLEFQSNALEVGAGALDRTVALTCAQRGLGGPLFLAGVPGTIGGAVKMNAGCYGSELKDILEWADIMDRDGMITRREVSELGLSYRHSRLGDQDIVIRARFRCEPMDSDVALRTVEELLAEREKTQPIHGRTGGSTFRNPDQGDQKIPYKKAWQLIDEAGCRGLQRGDAQVSTKHCNFLLNTDKASAQDLETLGEQVRQRVREHSGIDLTWEIIRVGEGA
jgi:UDP-N-acetylmuramate dehydrogenase